MSGAGEKRQFPYYSVVPGFALPAVRRADDPGREDAEAPRVWQAREQSELDEYDLLTVRGRGAGSEREKGKEGKGIS